MTDVTKLSYKNYEKRLNNQTFRDYYNKLKLLAKSVFKWNNLPNGIDEKWIEEYLFEEGKCMFFHDDKLGLMVTGCTGNNLNAYGENTLLQPVATNYTNTKFYENGEDCVLIRNNDECIATDDSILLYAYRLTDITRTIDINIAAQKTPVVLLCRDKQKLTYINLFKQWSGNEPLIIGDKELDLSSIKVLNTDAPIVFPQLQIEKNHIWNECMTFLGVNNANMDKRERLVDDEVQANNEQIMLFAMVMLKSRQKAAEMINEIFHTNISVEFRMASEGEKIAPEGVQNVTNDSEV